jgi:hypothetical protein
MGIRPIVSELNNERDHCAEAEENRKQEEVKDAIEQQRSSHGVQSHCIMGVTDTPSKGLE